MAIKRALVVDDSRSARLALRRLLEKQSLAVSEAESGEIALDMPQSAAVDVVFMDHTMPGMEGLEAVAAIKAHPATAAIPVMMYTTGQGEFFAALEMHRWMSYRGGYDDQTGCRVWDFNLSI